MESNQEVRRIIRMLWALIGLTIAMGVLVNIAMGWGISNQRDQQAVLRAEKEQTAKHQANIKLHFGKGRSIILNVLDPEGEAALFKGKEFVKEFYDSIMDLSSTFAVTNAILIHSMQTRATNLLSLLSQAHLWRQENLSFAIDIDKNISLNKVRDQLTRIRAIIDVRLERERIQRALQIRKYQNASPAEAIEQAPEIIENYIKNIDKSRNSILSDLTEIQRLVEVLAGEGFYDHLADIKDNKFKPSLKRLHKTIHSFNLFDSDGLVNIDAELENLNKILFGVDYRINEKQQTIIVSPNGFYSIRQNYFTMQLQKTQLLNELAEQSRIFEKDWVVFKQLEQDRQKGLDDQLGRELSATWKRIAFLSLSGAIIFLALVWLVFKAISKQVDTLAFLRRQAETSSEVKSKFLASMSHELRTPLNAIIGFSEVMQLKAFGALGNDKYEEYANDINMSGKHLLDIINDILDISSIEADKLEVHEENFDFSAVLDVSLQLVLIQAQKAQVKIINEVGKDAQMLRADGRLVRQILVNLLSNAIKFTPKDGSIWISKTISGEGEFLFSVKDTGIGMDREGIATALTPFGMVRNAYDGSYNGTGLGLPLVSKMMELHGGSIHIESQLGQGTEVTLLFPEERVIGNE